MLEELQQEQTQHLAAAEQVAIVLQPQEVMVVLALLF